MRDILRINHSADLGMKMDEILLTGYIIAVTGCLYGHSRRKRDMFFLLMGLVLTIFFCGFRKVLPGIPNNDTYAYLQMYEEAETVPLTVYLALHGIEALFYGFFWICANTGCSFTFARCIYYTLMYAIIVKTADAGERMANGYCDYLFLGINLVLGYCLMRMSFAYVMCWYAITQYMSHKKRKAVFISVTAFFVHFSAFLITGYFMFDYLAGRTKNIRKMLLLYISFVLLFLAALPCAFAYSGSVSGKIAYYIASRSGGGFALTTNLTRFIMLALLLFLSGSAVSYRRQEYFRHIILLLLCSFLIIPLQLVNGIAYRFLEYFNILNLAASGYIRGHIRQQAGRHMILPGPLIMDGLYLLALYRFITVSLKGYGLVPLVW